MKKLDYGFLDPARQMPPLHHTVTHGAFDIMDSEVAAWLVNVPEIRQKVFNMAMNHGVIVYDPDARMWKGADWSDR